MIVLISGKNATTKSGQMNSRGTRPMTSPKPRESDVIIDVRLWVSPSRRGLSEGLPAALSRRPRSQCATRFLENSVPCWQSGAQQHMASGDGCCWTLLTQQLRRYCLTGPTERHRGLSVFVNGFPTFYSVGHLQR